VRIGCVDEFQMASVERNREVLAEMFFAIFRVRARIAGERITPSEPHESVASKVEEEHPIVIALKRELGAEPI
jgi:hypothetical protein